ARHCPVPSRCRAVLMGGFGWRASRPVVLPSSRDDIAYRGNGGRLRMTMEVAGATQILRPLADRHDAHGGWLDPGRVVAFRPRLRRNFPSTPHVLCGGLPDGWAALLGPRA